MKILTRLHNLLRGARHTGELDEELAFHIDMRTEDNLRAGMTAADARREAELAFGNRTLLRERTRDFDVPGGLDALLQNLRYAFRALRASPVTTLVLVVSLALGIGANTAMFTVLNSLLLRPLPVSEPQALYSVTLGNFCSYGWVERDGVMNHALWSELRKLDSTFSGLFAYSPAMLDITEGGGTVRLIRGAYVTSEMWRVLGLQPAAGRFTLPSDEKLGSASAVAVIGEAFWESRFSRDPNIAGRTIAIVGRPVTIIGVAPRSFFGMYVGERTSVYLPLEAAAWLEASAENPLANGQRWWLTAVGRLGEGVSAEAARERLTALSPLAMQRTIPADWPKDKTNIYTRQLFELKPAATGFSDVRESLAEPLWIAFGLVALLLLLACANIAAVQLSRGLARQREFAVRIAVGSGRSRLGVQVFLESLLAAAAGASLGVLLSYPATTLLVTLYTTQFRPLSLDLQPDLRVLVFTSLLAILTALLFGLAPAVQATRSDPNGVLKAVRASGPVRPIRESLLAVQVALAVVLTVGALLFAGTLYKLTTQPAGIRAERVLLMQVETERAGVDAASRPAFLRRMADRLAAIPGVESAAASYVAPLSGGAWQMGLTLVDDGQSRPAHTYLNFVTPGFFPTYGTKILEGRGFGEKDDRRSAGVALVNRAFVQRYLDGRLILGRRLRNRDLKLDAEIVGVTEDAKYRNLRAPVPPTVYLPLYQHAEPPQGIVFALRSKATPSELAPRLREAMRDVNPKLPYLLRSFEEHKSESVANERAIASLTTLFGVLALLLAGVGIYGVAAYSVMQRRPEIGIRVSVGATTPDILRSLFGRTSKFIAAGALAGGLVASWAARFARTLLYEVDGRSLWIYASAAGLLLLISALALLGPAIRAARLDPLQTLRSE
ncbi:MAG: ADOP family duplicated permease [Bryobacteraceae bacterium]|nr:ADOP family duplicated permease [Bryobacteraceae bacterium]